MRGGEVRSGTEVEIFIDNESAGLLGVAVAEPVHRLDAVEAGVDGEELLADPS